MSQIQKTRKPRDTLRIIGLNRPATWIAFATYAVSLFGGIMALYLGEREIGLIVMGAAIGGASSYPVAYQIGRNGAENDGRRKSLS